MLNDAINKYNVAEIMQLLYPRKAKARTGEPGLAEMIRNE